MNVVSHLLGRHGWLLQGVGMLVLRHQLQARYLSFSIAVVEKHLMRLKRRYSLPLSILSIVLRAEYVLVVNPQDLHFWLCNLMQG